MNAVLSELSLAIDDSPVVMSFMVVLPPNFGGGVFFVFNFYCIFITKLFSILTEFLIFEKKFFFNFVFSAYMGENINFMLNSWKLVVLPGNKHQ